LFHILALAEVYTLYYYYIILLLYYYYYYNSYYAVACKGYTSMF